MKIDCSIIKTQRLGITIDLPDDIYINDMVLRDYFESHPYLAYRVLGDEHMIVDEFSINEEERGECDF